jgi:hypothetical protein
MAEKSIDRNVRIAGQEFRLRSRDVTRALRRVDPEPIARHFVVIDGRRFPPKQVISAVTGLDRADFTTHQARRTLMRLGFVAGRRGVGAHAASPPPPAAEQESLGERLCPFVGQFVAIEDDDILHADPSPHRLVEWLYEHGQRADSMFRVPEDELAASGLAPL